jgi:hypothetical protein
VHLARGRELNLVALACERRDHGWPGVGVRVRPGDRLGRVRIADAAARRAGSFWRNRFPARFGATSSVSCDG